MGASGGFDKKFLERRLKELLAKLPGGSAGRLEAPAPVFKPSRNLLMLDKPGRTQGQIIIGAPGVSFEDKDYFALLIANHVFGGGSFSARLMKEVREKRGWSYGAYSFYRSGRKPLYFAMQSTPSNKDTIPALNLMVELMEDYAEKGISKEEFAFAKKSLVNQSAFLQDTVRKRLDNKITEEVLKLPKGFYDKYRERLMGLTHAQVQAAIKRKVDPSRLFTVILGDADALKSDIGTLKGYTKIWRRKFDEAPTDLSALNAMILSPAGKPRKEISKAKA
jgi:zinc protease